MSDVGWSALTDGKCVSRIVGHARSGSLGNGIADTPDAADNRDTITEIVGTGEDLNKKDAKSARIPID